MLILIWCDTSWPGQAYEISWGEKSSIVCIQGCSSFHKATSLCTAEHPKMSHFVTYYSHSLCLQTSLPIWSCPKTGVEQEVISHIRDRETAGLLEVAGMLLIKQHKRFHLLQQQQCSKRSATIKHQQQIPLQGTVDQKVFQTNYPSSTQETWHPVFLLSYMDLMVFSKWPLPSTTLTCHRSTMTPRKTESGRETQQLRIIISEYYAVIDLMRDLGQAPSPLGISLFPYVSFA